MSVLIRDLLRVYDVLLPIATIFAFVNALNKPQNRKIDMGLLIYLTLSCLFSFFNVYTFKHIQVDKINSIYESIIIPSVFLARKRNWVMFIFINIIFVLTVLIGLKIYHFQIIFLISLLVFIVHHLFFEKKFNYLIHNLFLISVFVFSLLFDLFNIYDELFKNSKYQMHVFIFYSFFLYIFYIFIIFKYAKS